MKVHRDILMLQGFCFTAAIVFFLVLIFMIYPAKTNFELSIIYDSITSAGLSKQMLPIANNMIILSWGMIAFFISIGIAPFWFYEDNKEDTTDRVNGAVP